MTLAMPGPIAKAGAVLRNALGLDIVEMETLCPRGVPHEWVAYPGGSACLHCPAWKFAHRTEEFVEKDPAQPIDLRAALMSIRDSLAAPQTKPLPLADPDPETSALPAEPLPAEPRTLPTPIQRMPPGDRQFAIINAILPVIRQDVTLTELMRVADAIEEIP